MCTPPPFFLKSTTEYFFFVEKPERAVTVQCIECKKVRRFPCTNPDYKIWIEKFQDLPQNTSWFECKKVRRFPCTNPDYKIWIEKFFLKMLADLNLKIAYILLERPIYSSTESWFHTCIYTCMLKPRHSVFC